MIHLAQIHFKYPTKSKYALDEVDLRIPDSSLFALLGPNGAGKTTLLRVLCGRLEPEKGMVVLPSTLLGPKGLLDPMKYGVLIENPGIYPRLTVREYLSYFASFYNVPDLKDRIKQLAKRLHLREIDHRMSSLSLGMRQKVQVIRAILHRPTLVLLDEPSSNLDPISREEVWSLLKEMNQQEGTTLVVCSHLLGEMEENCSHVGIIRSGKIRATGTLDQVLVGGSDVLVRFARPLTEDELQMIQLRFAQGLIEITEQVLWSADSLRYKTQEASKTNALLTEWIVQCGLPLLEMRVDRPSLATVYRDWMEAKP